MILIVCSFWQDNAAQTEQLLEFIFAQNDRAQIAGHVLLVNAPAVDKELVERIKISAELAFRGVHQLELRALADDRAPKWKNINNAFTQAATHIAKGFRWPFLWMEPDCVPLRRGWHSRLVLEYGTQPKAYLGSRMKIEAPGKPEMFIMARNGIYPPNAINDIPPAEAPFEIAGAVNVFPKFTVAKLIQQTAIINESDLVKVREDAIICHSDKNGFLLRKLERDWTPKEMESKFTPETNPVSIPIAPGEPPASPEPIPVTPSKPRRGRPTKAEAEARFLNINGILPK